MLSFVFKDLCLCALYFILKLCKNMFVFCDFVFLRNHRNRFLFSLSCLTFLNFFTATLGNLVHSVSTYFSFRRFPTFFRDWDPVIWNPRKILEETRLISPGIRMRPPYAIPEILCFQKKPIFSKFTVAKEWSNFVFSHILEMEFDVRDRSSMSEMAWPF